MRYLFLLPVLFSLSSGAQGDSLNPPKKKVVFVPLPVIYRSPETGWAGGVSSALYFKLDTTSTAHLTRPSTIALLLLFTERGQNVQVLDATIYFPKERNILSVFSSHSYFPDRFWGIGPKTSDVSEPYKFENFYFFPHFKHKFGKHFFGGVLYEFQKVYHLSYELGGAFDTSDFLGKSDYKVSAMGLSASFDTRNSAYWPTKGLFSQLIYSCVNKVFFSDYNVNKFTFDTRFYQKTAYEQVFAMQFYSYFTVGDTPFRDLAALGGQTNLRGIYSGRYRDKNFASVIGEYRMPIYKRFAAVVFGGMGQVFKNGSDISGNTLRFSYGGGLRIELIRKERYNLRIDYGYSDKNNNGFYFTVGECF